MQKIQKYIMFKDYPPNDSMISDTFVLNTKYQLSYETTHYFVFTKNDNSEVAVNKSYEFKYFVTGGIQTSSACRM